MLDGKNNRLSRAGGGRRVVAKIQTRRRGGRRREELDPERLCEGCIEGGCRGQVRDVDDGDGGAGREDRH